MQKTILGLVLAILPVSLVYADGDYTIDPAHTYPNFTISHLGFSTMWGHFASSKGKFSLDRKANKGSVEVTIDAASIYTGHKKRDEHLRSPDFINAAEFPQITYKSTKVSFSGENKATIEGNLTLAGVTKPVTLNVTHIKCGAHPFNKKQVCGFDANTTIKRSDFGVKYGLPAIGDEMKLMFEVEGVKN